MKVNSRQARSTASLITESNARLNIPLINILDEFAEAYVMMGDDYRAVAYRNAARIIRGIQTVLTLVNYANIIERSNQPSGKRIGKRIKAKIKEYLDTGRVAELTTLKQSPNYRTAAELAGLLGVGPSTISHWLAMGITSRTQLKRAAAQDKIILHRVTAIGLEYYDDLQRGISRAEATILGERFRKAALTICPLALFEVAGSYRRGAAVISDLDIIISCNCVTGRAGRCEIKEGIMALMARDPRFIDIIILGDERISLLYESRGIARQVDMMFPQNYPAALLYFTGSKEFNERMRAAAKRQGLTLNQNGLFKDGRMLSLHSEREIFEAIGWRYVEPNGRQ